MNRFVDVLFIKDMGINFATMYHDDDGRLIKTRSRIAKRYIRGWFLIDVVTILPYDFAKLIVPKNAVKIVKLIRLMRLLKLARIVRASRIFNR